MVSPMTEKALAALKSDHESGAQKLSLKALGFLLEAARSEELAGIWSSEDYWKQLRWIAWHLAKNGRPSMGAAIESAILNALEEIEQRVAMDGSDTVRTCSLSRLTSVVESVLSSRIHEAGSANLDPIARTFTELIISGVEMPNEADQKYAPPGIDVPAEDQPSPRVKITTLSASGTVRAGLLAAIPRLTEQGVGVTITILESRPSFEGASFVNALLERFQGDMDILSKLKFEIVSDASVATAVKDSDFVVFGGDKVIPNGDVSNKIGTFSLAAMAKIVNSACKVVALFETSKITGSGFDSEYLAVEENDPEELINSWPLILQSDLYMKESLGAQVKVRNEYFEWVPAKFIDQYITENGIWGVKEIAASASEKEGREKQLFGDL